MGDKGETRPQESGRTIQHWHTHVGRQWETLADKGEAREGRHTSTGTHVGRQWETLADKGEAREGRHTSTGTHVGRQWETNGNKTSGRRAKHPTQAHVWGDNWETRPLEGGYDPRRRHHPAQAPMWGDNGRQWGDKTSEGGPAEVHMWGDNGKQWDTTGDGETRRETMEDNWGDNGRQWETRGDKTSRRRTHHPTQAHISRETMGDNEKQDFGKVDHPKQAHVGGETMGKNWRQWKTSGMGNTWGQPETRIDKKGDKGRPRKADTPPKTGTHVGTMGGNSETRRREGGHTIWGDHGKQWELRLQEGGHTIQHRCTHAGRQWERIGNNGGPGETRPREGGHTIQHRHTCGETVGDNGRGQRRQMRDNGLSGTEGVGRGDKTLGRRTHQPKQAHMWGDNERQDVRKADAPSNTDTHVGRQ